MSCPDHEPIVESLIPDAPIPAGAADFNCRLSRLLDGKPKDEATVAAQLAGFDDIVEVIAAYLYNLSSMLVGEGEQSIRLIEQTIATKEVGSCGSVEHARRTSRRAMCRLAIQHLAQEKPGSLDAPKVILPQIGCIDEDELDAAGVTPEGLDRMMAGSDRDRFRRWIEGLSTPIRVIFVMRAVAQLPAGETAVLLRELAGPGADGWTVEAVRDALRQGLCSLAAQVLAASSGR